MPAFICFNYRLRRKCIDIWSDKVFQALSEYMITLSKSTLNTQKTIRDNNECINGTPSEKSPFPETRF